MAERATLRLSNRRNDPEKPTSSGAPLTDQDVRKRNIYSDETNQLLSDSERRRTFLELAEIALEAKEAAESATQNVISETIMAFHKVIMDTATRIRECRLGKSPAQEDEVKERNRLAELKKHTIQKVIESDLFPPHIQNKRWRIAIPPGNELDRVRLAKFSAVSQVIEGEIMSPVLAMVSGVFGDKPAYASTILEDKVRMNFRGEIKLYPRKCSFEAHAIRHPGKIFLVPNAAEDLRFADLPQVCGPPFIKFYCGVPVTVAGCSVAVLSVVDYKVSSLSPMQCKFLLQVSKTVANYVDNNLINPFINERPIGQEIALNRDRVIHSEKDNLDEGTDEDGQSDSSDEERNTLFPWPHMEERIRERRKRKRMERS